MRSITFEEWEKEGTERFGEKKRNWKFICPSCKTVQTGQDFIDLTTLKIEEIPNYLGFSCIGRFTEKKGCNWTLGGLFQIHELEINREGEIYRRFEFAPKEVNS